ncbi:hypothetical protein J6590_025173 [Homalodisca vitripennis]|nr:hypothetical protein J6590_025173 [Homalodisca vitripennis]
MREAVNNQGRNAEEVKELCNRGRQAAVAGIRRDNVSMVGVLFCQSNPLFTDHTRLAVDNTSHILGDQFFLGDPMSRRYP